MSKTKWNIASCRYCGQMIQLEEKERTEEQAIEEAVMRCNCTPAMLHQRATGRRLRALENIQTLYEKESEEIQNLLRAAVDIILDDEMERIVLNLYDGVKCTISKNRKGELNVERIVTRKQKLSE